MNVWPTENKLVILNVWGSLIWHVLVGLNSVHTPDGKAELVLEHCPEAAPDNNFFPLWFLQSQSWCLLLVCFVLSHETVQTFCKFSMIQTGENPQSGTRKCFCHFCYNNQKQSKESKNTCFPLTCSAVYIFQFLLFISLDSFVSCIVLEMSAVEISTFSLI